MKPSVYVETTVYSFYHDDRSASARRRGITRERWGREKRRFDTCTSAFVIDELNAPVYPNWQKTTALARSTAQLEVVEDVAGIIAIYLEQRVMPADDAGDAAHLAVASYHGVDYLLTWNCRHLANANRFSHIREINRRLGLMTPELVTPEQLFEEK